MSTAPPAGLYIARHREIPDPNGVEGTFRRTWDECGAADPAEDGEARRL